MIFMLTSEQRLSAIQRLGRALSDPTRCRLLLALLEGADYPAGLADRLGLTRQNVSNHLACLRDCGLVRTQARGRQVSYELVDASLAHALEDLLGVVWGTTQPHMTLDSQGEPGEQAPVV
jgi:ArsR family transcriptional regulator, cadmium/lead-responsive transcriptional repressor